MKTEDRGVSVAMLHEMFTLDAETGVIRWKVRPLHHFRASATRTQQHAANQTNSRYAGKVAFGSRHQLGYLRTELDGKLWQAHRVAFALFHGRFPEGDIDHINGNPSDNRPVNLREVTHAENMRNQRLRTNNKSGRVGVYVRKDSGKWAAQIRVEGRNIALGLHDEHQAAIAARAAAEKQYGYHPNHGRKSA